MTPKQEARAVLVKKLRDMAEGLHRDLAVVGDLGMATDLQQAANEIEDLALRHDIMRRDFRASVAESLRAFLFDRYGVDGEGFQSMTQVIVGDDDDAFQLKLRSRSFSITLNAKIEHRHV